MLTDKRCLLQIWLLFCVAMLAMQILALGAVPFELVQPGSALWHALAFAALTMLAWIVVDGRRPILIVAGVVAFGAADGHSGSACVAALATAACLAFFTKETPCAESSAR